MANGILGIVRHIADGLFSLLDSINLGGFSLFQFIIVTMIIGMVVSVFVHSGKA